MCFFGVDTCINQIFAVKFYFNGTVLLEISNLAIRHLEILGNSTVAFNFHKIIHAVKISPIIKTS